MLSAPRSDRVFHSQSSFIDGVTCTILIHFTRLSRYAAASRSLVVYAITRASRTVNAVRAVAIPKLRPKAELDVSSPTVSEAADLLSLLSWSTDPSKNMTLPDPE